MKIKEIIATEIGEDCTKSEACMWNSTRLRCLKIIQFYFTHSRILLNLTDKIKNITDWSNKRGSNNPIERGLPSKSRTLRILKVASVYP